MPENIFIDIFIYQFPLKCDYALVFFFFTFDAIGAGVLNTVLKRNTKWEFHKYFEIEEHSQTNQQCQRLAKHCYLLACGADWAELAENY